MSTRTVGTVVRGIRGPIIREGDDLAQIVVDSVLAASKAENFEFHDRDVIAVTEAVVGRAQGNYATIDNIAADIQSKFPSGEFGLVFPILSRNRFSILFKGILKGAKKIFLQLSYPGDEVGNELVSIDQLDEKGINPFSDVLTESRFHELFGVSHHPFTGVDYIAFYRELAEEMGKEIEIILANDCRAILQYTKNVLCADIHCRARSKRLLKAAGAEIVFGLDEVLTHSIDGSGYNEDYGLLGSNKSTEDKVKLFPRDCKNFALKIQQKMQDATGKKVEAMVYGDGAFKDPVGKIWELADPVVSPGFTDGLTGTPNEIKLKYVADNVFPDLSGEELKDAITEYIAKKDSNLKNSMTSMGTTPRQITDLIGSLCDLTSGSGDKGTPFILVQGYFDNYSNTE
ncbi:F420-0 gamma-glutamyl ligase [Tritrichomonas foetus]|uniref:F420-0 gamma-glutamyl ligase n=1 Tax=Tritrichomonas foetus TaxID=1144522 RepID=A0A1J4KLQ5_9EUKA|nr:F420-0 gamma-glutamyl ligase [Tritrichomonas foetus]|eukprot:OHT10309.1 F420-0 gamma-glutamyl ligase [Tritrichomonas foetus]